jgi:MFS transporter, DHA1 family, multidrug resistance protein
VTEPESSSTELKIAFPELITLLALMVSLTALAIDTVLPALSKAGQDLGVSDANETQYIIGFLLLGLTLGQLIYGPLADSFGRKSSIYLGLAVFILGSLISYSAQSFEWMLIGRVLQGFGAAAPRVSSIAIVRDLFAGREMSRVLSFVMAVFIFVPVVAPALGELILVVSHWRMIFFMFILIALIISLWMFLRLPETLSAENRHPFSLADIYKSVLLVFGNWQTLGHTLSAGLMFSCLIGYLSCAQQIYQDYYDTGRLFVFYFAFSALSVGVASLFNSSVVRRIGMHTISRRALVGMIVISLMFLPFVLMQPEHTPFWAFMIFAIANFFCLGLLFGNLNAMAMEPMGHLAGVASSVIGALTSAISMLLGSFIGQLFNMTLVPLVAGFIILGGLALFIQFLLLRQSRFNNVL